MPQKIEEELKRLQALATADKNINLSALAINALQKHATSRLSPKIKRWGYAVSFLFPPFGLLFAGYFFFCDEEDAKMSALICVVLTAISIMFIVVFFKLMLAGSGLTPQQIQEVDVDEYRRLLE